jgi:hypothetical protein
VLHPVLVVALWIVFLHVRAAAFLAVGSAMHGDDGLRQEVVELERLDQLFQIRLRSRPPMAVIG